MATEFAIIDIGSNSIRYAEENCGRLKNKQIFTTRLGFGLAESGRLADCTMEKSRSVIAVLAEKARANGLVPMAYATSAVRDAANGREFAESIRLFCGVPVEILSGEDEARLAFNGAVGTDDGYDTLFDIGGASMQVVTRDTRRSFRAGCVRCADMFGGVRAEGGQFDIMPSDSEPAECDMDPLAKRAALRAYLDGEVKLPDGGFGRAVGVGGTVTTLAALNLGQTEFDADAVNGSSISIKELMALLHRLMDMGDKLRSEHPLLRARHDVILYGGFILEWLMDRFAEAAVPETAPDRRNEILNYSVSVSTHDGMEGYLYELKSR